MCEVFENENKTEQTNFDLPERGFEPQIFSNFPVHDLNFHGDEEPEIKSKQASKKNYIKREKSVFVKTGYEHVPSFHFIETFSKPPFLVQFVGGWSDIFD